MTKTTKQGTGTKRHQSPRQHAFAASVSEAASIPSMRESDCGALERTKSQPILCLLVHLDGSCQAPKARASLKQLLEAELIQENARAPAEPPKLPASSQVRARVSHPAQHLYLPSARCRHGVQLWPLGETCCHTELPSVGRIAGAPPRRGSPCSRSSRSGPADNEYRWQVIPPGALRDMSEERSRSSCMGPQ